MSFTGHSTNLSTFVHQKVPHTHSVCLGRRSSHRLESFICRNLRLALYAGKSWDVEYGSFSASPGNIAQVRVLRGVSTPTSSFLALLNTHRELRYRLKYSHSAHLLNSACVNIQQQVDPPRFTVSSGSKVKSHISLLEPSMEHT